MTQCCPLLFYVGCDVHLQDCFHGLYFIRQYTLESIKADGERIRCDKGSAPGGKTHTEGFKQRGGDHQLRVIYSSTCHH